MYNTLKVVSFEDDTDNYLYGSIILISRVIKTALYSASTVEIFAKILLLFFSSMEIKRDWKLSVIDVVVTEPAECKGLRVE